VLDVTDQLRVELAATYTNAEFDGFSGLDDSQPQLGIQDLDGEMLPHAPEYTVNLGVEYRAEIGGPLPQMMLRADINYSDDVVLRYFPRDPGTQDAYVLGSLSASFSDSSDRNTVRLFVDNIGDVKYLQNVIYLGGQGDDFAGNYGEPRTWGVQYSYRF
jgi:iron complex outermembrane receptor protein